MQHGFDVCECVSPERSLSVTRSIVDRIGSYSYLCVQTRLNIIRGDLLSGVDYRYMVRRTGDPQKKPRKMMKKTMDLEQKVSVFEKRISETLGTIVANQETTGILVYQVAESFSPADV